MTSFANKFKVFAVLAAFVALPAAADDITAGKADGYSHKVMSRISQYVVYPHYAAMHEQQGVVTLAVTLDKYGNVAALQLLGSSGVETIDHAALEAALAAAPYPKPTADKAEVKGKIRFAL